MNAVAFVTRADEGWFSTQRRKGAKGRKDFFASQTVGKVINRIKTRQFISVRPEPVEGMNGGRWLSSLGLIRQKTDQRPSAALPFDRLRANGGGLVSTDFFAPSLRLCVFALMLLICRSCRLNDD
ncbi:MAG: hypothetical protein LBL69_05890 [Zoogloeaceae bacterium]|jgi:hypothetical protein|nr:hypothetical protein [Zoogloeaceae bacterium]